MIKIAICFLVILSGGVLGLTFHAEEPRYDLLKKIEEGRERLKGESVQLQMGVVGTRRVRISRRRYQDVPITGIVGREMALAILEPSGKIKVVRAVKRDAAFEVLTEGFIISMRRENGINSDFACIDPAGGKVVAVKYPVSNEGNRFGPGDPVIEAVYTPYSAEIKTEEVIKRGIEVQNGFIERRIPGCANARSCLGPFPGSAWLKSSQETSCECCC